MVNKLISSELKNLTKLWHHLLPKRKRQLCGLVLLMIPATLAEILSLAAVLPFTTALISPKLLYENRLSSALLSELGITDENHLILMVVTLFILSTIVSSLMRVIILKLSLGITYNIGQDLAKKAFAKLLNKPYELHLNTRTSDVVSALIDKVDSLISNIIFPILSLLTSSLLIIFIFLTLIFINKNISLTVLITSAIFYAVINIVNSGKLTKNSEAINSMRTHQIKIIQEAFGGIRDVIINASEKYFIDKFTSSDKCLRVAQSSNAFIKFSPRYLIEGGGMIFVAIVALILVFQSNESSANVLPLLGLVALSIQRLLPLFQQLHLSSSAVRGASSSFAEFINILDLYPSASDLNQCDELLPFSNQIDLRNISFNYKGSSNFILHSLNLRIKKGERIGIVGSSGSGKSTLTDLIMGLLKPTSGSIYIDNNLLDDSNVNLWRKKIAHVSQHVFLADLSIAENIAFGVPAELINYEKIVSVLKEASLSKFISELPDGYNTIVGERGARLSGGQLQRIGIARALYKNASVIIFDEATSALDENTENEVMRAIDNLCDDLTVVIVTHRVSTLKKCTQIIEISNRNIQVSSNLNRP